MHILRLCTAFLFICTFNQTLFSQAKMDKEFSSEDWELSISFSKDKTMVAITKFPPSVIFYGVVENNQLKNLEVFPFSGQYSDSGVDFSPNGNYIIFSSDRPVNGKTKSDSDLWQSSFEDGKWTNPKHLGSLINNDKNEYSPSISSNGNIYFMKDDTMGYGGYDIYKSELKDGVYQTPVNLGSNINSRFNDEDPYISPDERFMIFMSQRPGDIGPCNLYISFNEKNNWSAPISLGNLVNTPRCDYSPFLSSDGYLYFFSYGGPTLNGVRKTYSDLYKAYHSSGSGVGDVYKVKWEDVLKSIKK